MDIIMAISVVSCYCYNFLNVMFQNSVSTCLIKQLFFVLRFQFNNIYMYIISLWHQTIKVHKSVILKIICAIKIMNIN